MEQCFLCVLGLAASKIRDVNWKHRQQAGGDKGDDTLEKNDQILHGDSVPFADWGEENRLAAMQWAGL